MADLLIQVRHLNDLGDRAVAEPFAGGAGAALSLLFLEETHAIYINDSDKSILDFWWSVTTHPRRFAAALESADLSMAEWARQRDIYRNGKRGSRLHRGFAAFYLNRCNRSGIIMNGGPIGGVHQSGDWKLDARFNRADLLKRCARIGEYASRIHVSGEDGVAFISRVDPSSVFFFIDPPYYQKGQTLYLNALDDAYHANLARQLQSMEDAAWVVTYDDCDAIRRLYEGWAHVRAFDLHYAAAERRTGKEVLITPEWMKLPSEQSSAALGW